MGDQPDSDTDLMLRVKRGDARAFELLVNRYKQSIMNLVCRMVPDRHEAEDLTQAVFVQVFRAAHRYRESARFSAWLYAIARNLCLNEIRRRSRHQVSSLDAPLAEAPDLTQASTVESPVESAPDILLQRELEMKVAEALDALPVNQRMAVVLYQQKALSYEEIAQVLDCSLSATKSLIFRARETLRQRLKPYLRTGEWT